MVYTNVDQIPITNPPVQILSDPGKGSDEAIPNDGWTLDHLLLIPNTRYKRLFLVIFGINNFGP